MNPISPECRNLNKTIYKVDYIPYSKVKPVRPKIHTSEDPLIIDGNCAINLNINNKPLPKTLSNHPTLKPLNEDYFKFINSIGKYSQVLYDRFFKDVDIDKTYIEKEISDINKTEYQYKYSPNEFLPLSGYVRLVRRNLQKPDKWKFHDTSYLSSYNRLMEYGNLREVLRNDIFRIPNRSAVADEVNRIFKTGKSIYQTSYSGVRSEDVRA